MTTCLKMFGNPNFDIDFNVVTQNGWTPIGMACSKGHFQVVKLLFLLISFHLKARFDLSKIRSSSNFKKTKTFRRSLAFVCRMQNGLESIHDYLQH